MYTFQLPTGETVIVDDQDVEFVKSRTWTRVKTKHGAIYVRSVSYPKPGKQVCIFLHRQLTGAPKGMQVDHRDGKTLDNRRENLRVVTPMINQQGYRTKRSSTRSRYRGVSWMQRIKKWQAKITVLKKQIYLGVFLTERAAADRYDEAAERFGFPVESTNAWMEKNCLLPHRGSLALVNH